IVNSLPTELLIYTLMVSGKVEGSKTSLTGFFFGMIKHLLTQPFSSFIFFNSDYSGKGSG
ncbi:MAG: hypothetical protein GY938_32790, partial [Ketobacter sp.]|nr:hypothetical protein [Ketobacter sp.]